MAIGNTPKHLVFLKAQAKAARAVREPRSFFMVLNRKTKDTILHIDPKQKASKYKNPAVIQKQLGRLKSLKPELYAELFSPLKDTVSAAGTVEVDDDGKTLAFTITVRSGKASEGDLTKGLKSFKFIKSRVVKGTEDEETETETAEVPELTPELAAKIGALFAGGAVSREAVVENLYAQFDSIDDLVEASALLQAQLAQSPDPVLQAQLDAMDAAIHQIDTLDDELGLAGLLGGMDELERQAALDEAKRDLIASALEQVRATWQAALKQINGTLAAQVAVIQQIAASLEPEQQGRVLQMASVDKLLGVTIAHVPALVRQIFADLSEKVHLNLGALGEGILELWSTQAEVSNLSALRGFDDAFETALLPTTSDALADIAGRLTTLEAQLA